MAVQQRSFEEAQKHIDRARTLLDTELVSRINESYDRWVFQWNKIVERKSGNPEENSLSLSIFLFFLSLFSFSFSFSASFFLFLSSLSLSPSLLFLDLFLCSSEHILLNCFQSLQYVAVSSATLGTRRGDRVHQIGRWHFQEKHHSAVMVGANERSTGKCGSVAIDSSDPNTCYPSIGRFRYLVRKIYLSSY